MIATITAGGMVDPAFARVIGTEVKALAPLGERRLIDAAIHAARSCGASSITVIGNDEVRAYCGARVDVVLPAVGDGRENLEAALRSARDEQPLLLLTSDLPFLTPSALADFLDRVGDAEVAMPLASHAAYTTAYPGAADHATAMSDERVANGSAFFFAPGAAPRAIACARRLFEARKSLPHMAMLLDLPLLLRFCFRRLRIEHVEAYAKRSFDLDARAVREASPALCYDIDSLEDYRYAVRFMT